jgi:hypothetical protein
MGVMLVVGFAALIVAIASRVAHRRPEAPFVRSLVHSTIDIPHGARVEAMTTMSDRLILDLVLPDGDRQIVTIDLATGARTSTIELRQQK